jgi:hypothetical protein
VERDDGMLVNDERKVSVRMRYGSISRHPPGIFLQRFKKAINLLVELSGLVRDSNPRSLRTKWEGYTLNCHIHWSTLLAPTRQFKIMPSIIIFK